MTPQKPKTICDGASRMAENKSYRISHSLTLAVVGLGVILALGACTKRTSVSNWQKAGVSQEQRGSDIGECRRFARRETEREAGGPSSASSADPLSGTQNYGQLTTNYDLGKFQDRMFAHCMKRLGYKPISNKKS